MCPSQNNLTCIKVVSSRIKETIVPGGKTINLLRLLAIYLTQGSAQVGSEPGSERHFDPLVYATEN